MRGPQLQSQSTILLTFNCD